MCLGSTMVDRGFFFFLGGGVFHSYTQCTTDVPLAKFGEKLGYPLGLWFWRPCRTVAIVKKTCLCLDFSLTSFPSESAVKGIKSVPSVCVCLSVCLLFTVFSTLTAEWYVIRTKDLAWELTLIISQIGSKVIGQGRHVGKDDFLQFLMGRPMYM